MSKQQKGGKEGRRPGQPDMEHPEPRAGQQQQNEPRRPQQHGSPQTQQGSHGQQGSPAQQGQPGQQRQDDSSRRQYGSHDMSRDIPRKEERDSAMDQEDQDRERDKR
jgi:hypothetical protein